MVQNICMENDAKIKKIREIGMEKNKAVLNNTLYIILCIVSSVVVGTLLMILVYCLPTDKIRTNVLHSVYIYSAENDFYDWATGKAGTKLDNFSDALMMNVASYEGTGNVIKDAMNNAYISYPGKSQTAALLLSAVLGDTDSDVVINYSRYWHGYLVWLKPMMQFATKADIRMLSMYVQITLLILVMIELYKKDKYRLIVPFLLAILCINPISMALCMQLGHVYYITLVGALVLLKKKLYDTDKYWHVFLWIGICTAFLDLTTSPLVGLGINLVLLLVLKDMTWKKNLARIVLSSLSWGIGYLGMWAGKWIVGSVLTGENVLKDAIETVLYRAAGDSMQEAQIDSSSAFDVIMYNVDQMLNTPIVWGGAVALLGLVVLIIAGKVEIKINQNRIVALAVVAAYPVGWYCIFKNHSAIHSWMTYRNLAISVFALALMLSYSVFSNGKKEE